MTQSNPSASSQPRTPATRRVLRWFKSEALRSDAAYRLYLRLKFGTRKLPAAPKLPLPNRTLKSRKEWEHVLAEAKKARLPLHRCGEKNWDHLAAVSAILAETTSAARVLDAGAEFYSNVLPTLYAYGYRNLYGVNLAFTRESRRGPIRYMPGDITRLPFEDSYFDAASSMSVIEHGVPLAAWLREMYRVLKPGGLLIASTDYYPTAINTAGKTAYGAPIKIFTRAEIETVVRLAESLGFERTGELDLDCEEKPVQWQQYGLEYSFVIFTLRKRKS